MSAVEDLEKKMQERDRQQHGVEQAVDVLDDTDSVAEVKRRKTERRFLLKLDVCLITWAWLAYLIKVGAFAASSLSRSPSLSVFRASSPKI